MVKNMSDSSDDEDLSKFREAVDNTFSVIKQSVSVKPAEKSERYLEVSSHYNDVKVPEEMQKRIGAKVSALIQKNISFIDVTQTETRNQEYMGGVKLFNTSSDFLSCEVERDVETEIHNKQSKKIKNKKRQLIDEDESKEKERIVAVAVTGEYIQSGKEPKHYKSRRKEKLYKYKTDKKSNRLVAVELNTYYYY